ncbi:MAG: hypothetical protein ACON5B_00730 [Myxococcota bacterium]
MSQIKPPHESPKALHPLEDPQALHPLEGPNALHPLEVPQGSQREDAELDDSVTEETGQD